MPNQYPRFFTQEDRRALFAETDGRCWYCGETATSIDHIHPRSRGGSKEIWNLCPACKFCNDKKRDMLLEEFRIYVAKQLVSCGHASAVTRQIREYHQFYGEIMGIKMGKEDHQYVMRASIGEKIREAYVRAGIISEPVTESC